MNIPEHVAIIMDGNGRWAKKRNLPGIMGHRAGVKTVDIITEACSERGIKALTLYAFSTENWKRPKKDVNALMRLLKGTLQEYAEKIKKNNVRFNMIGRLGELPPSLKSQLEHMKEFTSGNSGMVMTLAINYGSRQELVDAVKEVCKKVKEGSMDADTLSEEDLEKFLYTYGLPPLDLVIRTSGEMRLSNFLLWQAAYAEIYATKTLWPDFGVRDLDKALKEYGKRERRFGG